MATYVDEADLVKPYVDEADLLDAPPKKAAEKPREPAGGNVFSKILGAVFTGPSKAASGLADLATAADLSFRQRFGLPTLGVSPADVRLSPKVDALNEAIVQGTMFPVKRDKPFWEEAAQRASGSLLFPGGVIRNIGASVTSDVLQKEVKDAGGGQGAQAAAGIIGALPWAVKSPGNVFSTPQQQAEKSLAGYSPQKLKEAIELQKAGAAAKLPISAAQALGDRGRVLDLENFVIDSPFTPKTIISEALEQPAKARKFAERIARTFGTADDSLLRSNKVESIIEEALQFPVKAAGKASQPYYTMFQQARPQLSISQRFSLADDLGKTIDDVGLLPRSASGGAAEKIAGTVAQPSSILRPTSTVVRSAAQGAKQAQPFMLANPDVRSLDNYLKEISEQISGTYSPFATSADKVQRAGLVPGSKSIREAAIAASPELRRGKEVYQQTLDRLEPAVRATGLREAVARPAMEDTAAKAAGSWEKMEAVLKKGNQNDVTRAMNIMKTEAGGGEGFVDITKNMLNRIFDKHFSSESGKAGVSLSFAEELKKYPNIRKVVELTAAERGAPDPVAVSEGFMRALDIQQAAGRARGLPGGATLSEIEKYAAGKTTASLVFGHGIARAATIVRNVQYRINKAEMERLAAAFDSPRSIELLIELSKEKGPISLTEHSLYKALIGASSAEQPENVDNPYLR